MRPQQKKMKLSDTNSQNVVLENVGVTTTIVFGLYSQAICPKNVRTVVATAKLYHTTVVPSRLALQTWVSPATVTYSTLIARTLSPLNVDAIIPLQINAQSNYKIIPGKWFAPKTWVLRLHTLCHTAVPSSCPKTVSRCDWSVLDFL